MIFGEYISTVQSYHQLEVYDMKPSLKLLGVGLVVLLAASSLAAAGGYGTGPLAGDGVQAAPGGGNGVGPVATADRPFDGHNSPWMTGDERLERFQERFGLTDEQVDQIRTEVQAMIQDGADHDAIRAQVQTMLENFGVDIPALGPMNGQHFGDGPRGHGLHGPADGMARTGGPNGPADGSCMN